MSRKPYVHPKYGECHSHRPRSMPHMFDELAAYNGRCNQGIMHTLEYQQRMAQLQAMFDDWLREQFPDMPPREEWAGGKRP